MVHEETKSLISGSNANNTEHATQIIGRLNSRLIRTIIIAIIVTAAALIVLEMMRKESAPMAFRNSSKPVAKGTINAKGLDLELLAENHGDNSDTKTNINNARQAMNWTVIHLAETEKTKQDLQVLKDKMQSRFIALDPSEGILNYQQLEEQFRPLLQERGMLLMGDSTTRLLFGNLWCLMEGAYRSDAELVEDVCQERLDEMKGKCQFAGTPCNILANFTNETTPFHLEFQVHWFIGEMQGNAVDVIRRNHDRFIFYLLPCIHQLWLPGSLEKYVDSLYPTCYPFFPNLFTSIEKANPAHAFFVGTTTAICESKLWAKKMVDMYLEDKEFVNGTPRPLATMYRNKHSAPLAANYSGPIPVLTPSRKNHTCDNFLFDDAGGMNCAAVGLEALVQHSLFHNNSAVKVLDIRGASEFGCDDTTDGVHYTRGLSLRRQLMLLLRGMQSMP